jgi:hypothetical protein
MVILKLILRKEAVKMWTEFNCFRRFQWYPFKRQRTFDFPKR